MQRVDEHNAHLAHFVLYDVLIKLGEDISLADNMNCVKQNVLCWNNIQSRSSLDLLLSHLLSVLFSLQCIILQTEITLIISRTLFVLCVCAFLCVSISLFGVTICQYRLQNSPAR